MSEVPGTFIEVSRTTHDALLLRLSPAERLQRAIRLSEGIRALVWAGATQAVGAANATGIRRRVLVQLYGQAVAEWFEAREGA